MFQAPRRPVCMLSRAMRPSPDLSARLPELQAPSCEAHPIARVETCMYWLELFAFPLELAPEVKPQQQRMGATHVMPCVLMSSPKARRPAASLRGHA